MAGPSSSRVTGSALELSASCCRLAGAVRTKSSRTWPTAERGTLQPCAHTRAEAPLAQA